MSDEGTKRETLRQRLQERYEQLTARVSDFRPGDIVKWKTGLRNRRRPTYGDVAIVIEKLKEPVFDESEKSAGSAYFREPLDLIIGIIDDDGDFLCYHVDSRRFEKAE